jgi:nucleoside-diphosphate-sugar epimerase
MTRADVALIIGCGYLGQRLAHRLLEHYSSVWITTRAGNPPVDKALAARCRCVALDLLSPTPHWSPSSQPTDLFCLVPPAALANEGARTQLLSLAHRLPLHRAVLTSSTAVYGDGNGEIVSAESAIKPTSERAHLLATIEHTWRRDPRFCVVRLAGLYGPGRVIGLQSLRQNEALGGNPSELLNLIHVDDAAALLMRCIETPEAVLELGSDGHPVTRGEYYRFVATCAMAPPPRFSGDPRARGGNRRCDPASTMARVGWRPRYATYREGVFQALG